MTQQGNVPTFRPNRGVRFYNPGDRINETISFTMPGGSDIHTIAHWPLDAPPKEFFQVPTQLKLYDGVTVNVDFPTTVTQRFKDRGVICIDPEWEEPEDEDKAARSPFAKDDKAAIAKGEKFWLKYLERTVRAHIEACDRARAMGGFPREAQGFTARAFKLLNMVDPAEKGFESYKAASATPTTPAATELQSEEAKALRGELDATKKTLDKILNLLAAKQETEANAEIEQTTSRKRKSA